MCPIFRNRLCGRSRVSECTSERGREREIERERKRRCVSCIHTYTPVPQKHQCKMLPLSELRPTTETLRTYNCIICMCVCVCVYACVCVCVCHCVYMCLCATVVCTCVCVCMCARFCASVYVYMCLCVLLRVCV